MNCQSNKKNTFKTTCITFSQLPFLIVRHFKHYKENKEKTQHVSNGMLFPQVNEKSKKK